MAISSDLIARGLGATDLELGLGKQEKFRVFIRDNEYNRVDQLTEWQTFTYVKRFNRVGTWELRIAANSFASNIFRENYGIIVTREVEGVERVDFSGSIGSHWEETSEYIQMAGWCDNRLLETTARPTPSLNQGPYTNDYYTFTGIASLVMRDLVVKNIGPEAPSEWIVPGLDISDANPLVGSVITARARFDSLIVLLAELASTPLATGLGFRIQQADDVSNQLEFQIYVPRDKSVDTVFSTELQTARDYRRVFIHPSANYFQVGGGDNFGLSRTIVEGGDAVSIAEIGRRIPVFVDRRGVTDLGELEQELAELIAGAVSSNTITIVPTDIPAYQYGPDYDLGDLVTTVVRGISYSRLIRDIEVNLSPTEGVQITPTISDPFGDNDDVLAQHLSTLENRLSNIERNWTVPDDSIIEDMLHPTMKWYPGDIKITARSSAQLGWLLCDGSAISRSTYSRLFSAIGTIYGVGNGSTTFNIPDTRDRYVAGVGVGHSLGELSGASTINIGAHNHPHSHGMGHTHSGAAHTHPLIHSHGLTAHVHSHNHLHQAVDAHEHGGITSGPSSDTGRASGALDAATDFHWHDIATDNMAIETASPAPSTFGSTGVHDTNHGNSFSTTQGDDNAGNATFTTATGPANPASTESDNNSAPDTPVPFDPPNIGLHYEIYTGLIP